MYANEIRRAASNPAAGDRAATNRSTPPYIKKRYESSVAAMCVDCGRFWEWQSPLSQHSHRGNLRAVAAQHARTYDHRVRVDEHTTARYNGRAKRRRSAERG